jgi:hypothetical protein
MPLAVGTGLIDERGKFFRVADVWVSFDHHGHYPEGVHVFLEPTEIPVERLDASGREYFRVG